MNNDHLCERSNQFSCKATEAKMKQAAWVAVATLFSGCAALGPDYTAPELDPPHKFVGGATEELFEASSLAWWKSFNDPALNDLVAIGLDQNLNVRTAMERIVAAQENTRLFGLAQQVDGNASLDARRRETSLGVIDETSSLNADAFFVFDLFGEFRRSREKSLAELKAAEFDAGTVKLAYLADVVTSYVLVRYYQLAAQITRETITSRRRTLNTARQRADAQEGTQLEVAQAESLLATAEASLPILVAQARVSTFRIATLLDLPTGTVADRLKQSRGIPGVKGGSESGIPADLLRNRPDIRAAERRLAAATAAVGVSEAQLYPSLHLTGSITAGQTDTWSFGPSLILPVFDQARRQVARNVALSTARQAELDHRLAYVSAIEEVQVALTLTHARSHQVGAYSKATSSAERVLNLARRSYEAGVVTIDDVLDAERTRLDNRLNLAQAQSEYAQAWIQQQVATGKGWAVVPGRGHVLAQK
ncbi:MAG: efflux transporter outer membrane subunit [Ruegeria sp.]